jgi:hypothetical protein
VRDALSGRLGRLRNHPAGKAGDMPDIGEILDIDGQYRREAAQGKLKLIAPRRFNPEHKAWLPVLHTTRGSRHYTALFSNTARAHELKHTDDWVVVYFNGSSTERQCTVVTATYGALQGRRIVRGREAECEQHYQATGSH